MTNEPSEFSPLKSVLAALVPAHEGREPRIEREAPARLKSLWAAIGESEVVAPHGLSRDAWLPAARRLLGDGELPKPQERGAHLRWLSVFRGRATYVEEPSGSDDPAVWELMPPYEQARLARRCTEHVIDGLMRRVPAERQATYFFGSGLDGRRRSVVAGYEHLHALADGVFSWRAPPPAEGVEPIGATIFFRTLPAYLELVRDLAPEDRPYCRAPRSLMIGVDRQSAPWLDPTEDATAPGLALTEPFDHVTRGGRRLTYFSQVGTLDGEPVWIEARDASTTGVDQVDPTIITISHDARDVDALVDALGARGATVLWYDER